MLYMLDTNICSYIIRNRPASIREKLQQIEMQHTLALSSIVTAELLYGAHKKQSPKLTQIVSSFIDNFVLYDFDKRAASFYATVRNDLERQGNVIGANDLLIASHALALDAVLVTNNTREFARVEGLVLEDWAEQGSLVR